MNSPLGNLLGICDTLRPKTAKTSLKPKFPLLAKSAIRLWVQRNRVRRSYVQEFLAFRVGNHRPPK